jgi:hypothetical protein
LESYGKKFLFKAIVDILTSMKSRNQVLIGTRRIRNVLERKLDYSVSTNLLSRFVSISLDWLAASGYLMVIKPDSPKRYLIPDNFEMISKNINIFF